MLPILGTICGGGGNGSAAAAPAAPAAAAANGTTKKKPSPNQNTSGAPVTSKKVCPEDQRSLLEVKDEVKGANVDLGNTKTHCQEKIVSNGKVI